MARTRVWLAIDKGASRNAAGLFERVKTRLGLQQRLSAIRPQAVFTFVEPGGPGAEDLLPVVPGDPGELVIADPEREPAPARKRAAAGGG